MPGGWLDFEQPLVELEQRIEDLRLLASRENLEADRELKRLAEKADSLRRRIFSDLTPWQRVQLARHPQRPYTLDYIPMLFSDFVELRGDRAFAEDTAIVAGLARFRDRPVAVVGHQKGRNTRENLRRNFGMPQPEGYRKALRVMQLAEKFGNPVITFVDTPGAYPGIGAEERGQAEAIARNVREMTRLRVPIVVVVTGEGGSGGALAIAVGDRVYMLEYAFYSVISPEGCASILWKTREKAPEAAAALRFTAPDLLEMGVVDGLLPEPPGAAHRSPAAAAATIGDALAGALAELEGLDPGELVERRRARYLAMGAYAPEP
ncbi:MAG: acetyl-CoA carboxylase carboxyltransferase subunit alpha [Candidatus Eisenbacteria bacterium]|uniref:Acetyl-coenzyme A carboxylase carboxyl transferase subunit alpha n=1 Tax=Eiseniibacteriota bacterium TaxID=2212470 RepID=A0A937XC17_UNCEI|nr:acetyl-CoA carboxylase carboxyltransferase subunit alpha [Candidatus Eisenbacteria bacterium]